ncbi:hypothetical protein Tco_0345460 [Tanacetum coccineum]
MAAADAHEETKRVKVNCTSEDTLQQASTSGTQSDNAPVYDSDGSTEGPKDENSYNDMQQKIERLQAQLGELKGKSSDTQCASNTLDLVSQKLKDENVSRAPPLPFFLANSGPPRAPHIDPFQDKNASKRFGHWFLYPSQLCLVIMATWQISISGRGIYLAGTFMVLDPEAILSK